MDNPFKKFAEEWKKATPKEKLMIVGAGASVVAIALYLHHKTSSSAPGTGVAGLPSSFQPATGSTGSTGTTGTGSLLGATGAPDTGSFSAPAPTDTGTVYAPPPYTGTGTPAPTYNAPVSQSTGSYHQIPTSLAGTPRSSSAPVHTLPGRLQPGGQLVSAPAPRLPVTPPIGGVALQPGRTAVVSPTGISAPGLANIRSQPTVLASTYSAIRHAPAPAPVITHQIVPINQQIPRGRSIAG